MKFENTQVFNFEGAFRGLRNPLNSWDKSDSYMCAGKYCSSCKQNPQTRNCSQPDGFIIGPEDMKLAQKLIKAGPEHRKFLRQIFVSVDITAPIYWWNQMDTYKIGTTANSTSKMHKLATTPITIDCFEHDDFNSKLIYYKTNDTGMLSDIIIEQLEYLRLKYLETKDKRYWKELVRWLPESWLQTRTWSANYEVIRTICQQRCNHKLNEWAGKDVSANQNFIAWAKTLPHSKYLIFDDENKPF